MRIALVEQWADLAGVLRNLGLGQARPVIVLVGGARQIDETTLSDLEPAFARLARTAAANDMVVIDGATDVGVPRLAGRARDAIGGFALVGIAAKALVVEPGGAPCGDQAILEPNHSHVLLVPGTRWGDEVPWIQRTANLIAGGENSITLLANGGEIALADAEESVSAGRHVLAIAGSGRAADAVAAASRGDPASGRLQSLVASQLVSAIELKQDGGVSLVREVETILGVRG